MIFFSFSPCASFCRPIKISTEVGKKEFCSYGKMATLRVTAKLQKNLLHTTNITNTTNKLFPHSCSIDTFIQVEVFLEIIAF